MARAMASELQCQRVIDPLSFGESVPLVQTVNHLVRTALSGYKFNFIRTIIYLEDNKELTKENGYK